MPMTSSNGSNSARALRLNLRRQCNTLSITSSADPEGSLIYIAVKKGQRYSKNFCHQLAHVYIERYKT
jgi:hypothetical protein